MSMNSDSQVQEDKKSDGLKLYGGWTFNLDIFEDCFKITAKLLADGGKTNIFASTLFRLDSDISMLKLPFYAENIKIYQIVGNDIKTLKLMQPGKKLMKNISLDLQNIYVGGEGKNFSLNAVLEDGSCIVNLEHPDEDYLKNIHSGFIGVVKQKNISVFGNFDNQKIIYFESDFGAKSEILLSYDIPYYPTTKDTDMITPILYDMKKLEWYGKDSDIKNDKLWDYNYVLVLDKKTDYLKMYKSINLYPSLLMMTNGNYIDDITINWRKDKRRPDRTYLDKYETPAKKNKPTLGRAKVSNFSEDSLECCMFSEEGEEVKKKDKILTTKVTISSTQVNSERFFLVQSLGYNITTALIDLSATDIQKTYYPDMKNAILFENDVFGKYTDKVTVLEDNFMNQMRYGLYSYNVNKSGDVFDTSEKKLHKNGYIYVDRNEYVNITYISEPETKMRKDNVVTTTRSVTIFIDIDDINIVNENVGLKKYVFFFKNFKNLQMGVLEKKANDDAKWIKEDFIGNVERYYPEHEMTLLEDSDNYLSNFMVNTYRKNFINFMNSINTIRNSTLTTGFIDVPYENGKFKIECLLTRKDIVNNIN